MSLRKTVRGAIARILLLAPTRLTGASVLMYHSIGEPDGGFLTDTPEQFERHMQFIKERGYRSVFASEIPALLRSGDLANTVCVTLDDGYRDNYDNAFPILKRNGIKATVFLITGILGTTYTNGRGKTTPMVHEAQVREMASSGVVEFMPHTHTHTEVKGLDLAGVERELATSKSEVERLTGKRANVFAYPRGKYDDAAIVALKRHGFEAAFSVRPGIVRSDADPFTLPRNPLGDISDAELALKLSDRLETYLKLKRGI